MARNRVQFQKGYSLEQFMDEYGCEENCTEALFRWRWPNGFVCLRCEHTGHWRHESRALFRCLGCRHQVLLTAGTTGASMKLPLCTWFLAIYLMTQTKKGISVLELSRQLSVICNTASKVKHKLMQVMKERDDTRPFGGRMRLDAENYLRFEGSPQHWGFAMSLVRNQEYLFLRTGGHVRQRPSSIHRFGFPGERFSGKAFTGGARSRSRRHRSCLGRVRGLEPAW